MPRDRYNPEDEFRYRRRDEEYRGRDERGRRTYARDYDYENTYRDERRHVADLRDERGFGHYGDDYGRAQYPGPPPRYPRDPSPAPGRYDEDDRYSGRMDGRRRPLQGGPSRSHVRCRDIMTRDVTVAQRGTTLEQVAAMMRDEDTGVIPVVDEIVSEADGGTDERGGRGRRGLNRSHSNGRLAGLITDRDIVVRAIAEGMDRTAVAEEIMTTDIHTARPNDRVIEVIRTMGDKQVRRIPVVDDNNNLVGIISMADVALETENDRELGDALEEISSGSSFWSKIFG